MRMSFCPYCGSTFPADSSCTCRKRKRKKTEADAYRSSNEPWRSNYTDPTYQKNRQTVIERAHGRCERCNKLSAIKKNGKWVTSDLGGEVHHKVALRDGGTNDVDNLAFLCKVCHSIVDAFRRRS